jgi:hypothetical protein
MRAAEASGLCCRLEGDATELRYAPIAAMSGLMPTMFITRVKLYASASRRPDSIVSADHDTPANATFPKRPNPAASCSLTPCQGHLWVMFSARLTLEGWNIHSEHPRIVSARWTQCVK